MNALILQLLALMGLTVTKVFATLSAIFLLTISTHAATVGVGGRGTLGCDAANVIGFDKADQQWIFGFLSGYAIATGRDVFKSSSFEAILQEVTRRCKLKDKAQVYQIVLELAHELAP
jgi:hypothetical protein